MKNTAILLSVLIFLSNTSISQGLPDHCYPAGGTECETFGCPDCGEMFSSDSCMVSDLISPVLECPDTINVETLLDSNSVAVNYSPPVAWDECSSATTFLVSGLGSGAEFPIGTSTEEYLATDLSGNTSSCSFDIIVVPGGPDPEECLPIHFEDPPNGLFNVQTATTTQLKWVHYSDVSDGCIIKGGTIGALDVTEAYTQSPGQILLQGGSIAGTSGLDFSGQLAPDAMFQLFVVSQFPSGPTGEMVPGAFYKWQVQCGCLINPTLPLPQRLQVSNVIISPWSEFDLFTNLALPAFVEEGQETDQFKIISEGFTIYPNPTRGDVTIDLTDIASQVELITVINTLGEIVFQRSSFDEKEDLVHLDLNGLSNGVYIVSVITEFENLNSRLIMNK